MRKHKSAGRGPLPVDDIVEGMVAYFTVATLNSDPLVMPPDPMVPRDGPFVCVAAGHSESVWLEVTRQPGRPLSTDVADQVDDRRILIPSHFRKGGSKLWRTGPQYINNLRSYYKGPHASFSVAARNAQEMLTTDWPMVDLGFVEEIRRRMNITVD